MIRYTKRNIAIASAETFAQNQGYDTLAHNVVVVQNLVTCSQTVLQNALK